MICWLAAGLVNSMDDDEDSHNLAQAAEMVFDRGAGLTRMGSIYEALDVLSSSAYDVEGAILRSWHFA
jgi:hypothetical protein